MFVKGCEDENYKQRKNEIKELAWVLNICLTRFIACISGGAKRAFRTPHCQRLNFGPGLSSIPQPVGERVEGGCRKLRIYIYRESIRRLSKGTNLFSCSSFSFPLLSLFLFCLFVPSLQTSWWLCRWQYPPL